MDPGYLIGSPPVNQTSHLRGGGGGKGAIVSETCGLLGSQAENEESGAECPCIATG